MKHSNTPWKVRSGEMNDGTKLIDGADGLALAFVSDKNKVDGIERDANAAFIITACNTHEDLIESLKRIQSMFAYGRIENADDEIVNSALVTQYASSELRNLILEITGEALKKAGVK